MTDTENKQVQQDSDYDGAWKEIFHLELQLMMQIFFTPESRQIDWSYPPEWYEQEISGMKGKLGKRNKYVDLLVKVKLLTGEFVTLWLHLEIQSRYEPNFATRLADLNCGLRWKLGEKVVTLAVLADLSPNWRPKEESFEFERFKCNFEFPICKLLDHIDTDWKGKHSLPIEMARAQLAALRTAGDPLQRFDARFNLIRSLYNAGYTAEEVRRLFVLIGWMMKLPEDLEEEFQERIETFEKETSMTLLTSFEIRGEARGKALGQVLGQTGTIIRLAEKRFGPLPEQFVSDIRELSSPSLDELIDEFLDMKTLTDLQEKVKQLQSAAD